MLDVEGSEKIIQFAYYFSSNSSSEYGKLFAFTQVFPREWGKKHNRQEIKMATTMIWCVVRRHSCL
jgi:hypothetical protein